MTSYTVPEAFIASQRCGRRQQCQRDADRIAALEAENKLYEDALANSEQRCAELEAENEINERRVSEYLATIANQERLVDTQEADIKKLEAERDRLRVIRCPDGRMHRWDGDGRCKDCCNYATDLIEAALEGEGD